MSGKFFPDIPIMDVPSAVSAKAEHYGATNFIIKFEKTLLEDYKTYLKKLDDYGFVKYADNGDGLDHAVYTATYVKDNLVLTILYVERKQTSYASLAFNMPLSEHLIYKNEYVADNKEGAKTTLHMLELWRLGNSFVFQLKNGHFVISDGGLDADLPYLLDYLEKLTPKDEKPVVEAWIFSHGHKDHCGVLEGFYHDRSQAERLSVEGIYYSEPNQKVTIMDAGCAAAIGRIKGVVKILRKQDGTHPLLYRPQTGQRYYFNDITMDILFTQEQLPREEYDGDFNDSSTICMFTIEGQKCFFSGDAHRGGLRFVKDAYSREYLDLDIFTLNHHGFNTWNEFTDYATIKTALFTVQKDTPVRRTRENDYLRQTAKEWFVWGDGTKIMKFPYKIGEYHCLPQQEWIYNQGQKRLIQPNIYVYPKKLFHEIKAVIFDVDGTLLDTEKIYMQTWREVSAEFGYTIPEELLVKTRGVEDEVGRKYFLETMGDEYPYDEIRKKRKKMNLQRIEECKDIVRPGVSILLEWLKQNHILTAVASAKKTAYTKENLKRAGILQFFDVIIGEDMVRNNKPSPDSFLKACDEMGVTREQCLVVGDTSNDVYAANSAGMKMAFVGDIIPVTEELENRIWMIPKKIEDLITVIKKENEERRRSNEL